MLIVPTFVVVRRVQLVGPKPFTGRNRMAIPSLDAAAKARLPPTQSHYSGKQSEDGVYAT